MECLYNTDTPPEEIREYPFAMRGSDQHIDILLGELQGGDLAFTATEKGDTTKMLILNEQQVSQLRAKGYTFDIFRNPLYEAK